MSSWLWYLGVLALVVVFSAWLDGITEAHEAERQDRERRWRDHDERFHNYADWP